MSYRDTQLWNGPVAAIALTAMSLIVSWKSLEVSRDTLRISKEAEDLAEAQVGPIFRLESAQLYQGDLLGPPSEEDKRFFGGIAWLKNDGQPTLSWELEYTTFLRVRGKGSTVEWLPLTDPIDVSREHDRIKDDAISQIGRLATFREERWFLNGYDVFLKKVYEACRNNNTENACQIVKEQGPMTVGQIKYMDKLGRPGKAPWYFTVFSEDDNPAEQNELSRLYEQSKKAERRFSLKELAPMKLSEMLKLAKR